MVKGNEGLRFRSAGVQKGGAKYIHTLDIDSGLRAPGFGPIIRCRRGSLRMLYSWGSVLQFWATMLVGCIGDFARVRGSIRLCIVQFPSHCVEKADNGIFPDSSLKKHVRHQSAVGVIAYFSVCWGRPTTYQIEVDVC